MTTKMQLLFLAIAAGGMSVAMISADRSDAATTPTPEPTRAIGNAAAGATLFLQCRACHTVTPGAKNAVGPNLAGVLGAKAATRAGYTYSPALQAANLTWDKPTIDAWLTRPSKLVPGNKMTFAGISDPQARASIIAYLATLKN